MKSVCILFTVLATHVIVGTAFKQGFASQGLASARYRRGMMPLQFDLHDASNVDLNAMHSQLTSMASNSWFLAEEAVSAYSKVDKTGFIGTIATYIEVAIDFGTSVFNAVGIKNAYGLSIIMFTLFIKALTLPLTYQQLESTTRIQKLTPLQQKIQAKFAGDEEVKNKLMAQLFQAAQVNPLAGCFPALVQIPIFISLYRALTNLVAQNKLDEPFLWIPDLQGPVYQAPPSKAMDWIYSIFSGNPSLGWSDTLAFLSLPFILYISQTISQKVLTPPRDPNRAMTEQEQFSQGLISNLPLIVAFFSINVPAGLGIYWVSNNILTTLITIAIKSQIKDEPFPAEVDSVMAFMDSGTPSPKKPASSSTNMSPSAQEFRGGLSEEKSKVEGFGFRTNGEEQDEEGSDEDGDAEDGQDAAGSGGDAAKSKKRSKAGKKNRRR